jgi:hypothetical protein
LALRLQRKVSGGRNRTRTVDGFPLARCCIEPPPGAEDMRFKHHASSGASESVAKVAPPMIVRLRDECLQTRGCVFGANAFCPRQMHLRPGASSFDLDASSFELGASGFELRDSSFELKDSSFDLKDSSFELKALSFELNDSSFELKTSKLRAESFEL